MQRLFKIAILFLSLTLIQCSSDENIETDDLVVNGLPFKIQDGLIEKNENNVTLTLVEEDSSLDHRKIAVFAMFDSGNASGTYNLRSNMIEPGVANAAVFNFDNEQIAGGAVEQPTGTVTISHRHGNVYKLTFNDVTLDPGTASETTISGSCTRKFAEGASIRPN
jgi:hypothetical protein